jgi:hypothetical protein
MISTVANVAPPPPPPRAHGAWPLPVRALGSGGRQWILRAAAMPASAQAANTPRKTHNANQRRPPPVKAHPQCRHACCGSCRASEPHTTSWRSCSASVGCTTRGASRKRSAHCRLSHQPPLTNFALAFARATSMASRGTPPPTSATPRAFRCSPSTSSPVLARCDHTAAVALATIAASISGRSRLLSSSVLRHTKHVHVRSKSQCRCSSTAPPRPPASEFSPFVERCALRVTASTCIDGST